MQATPTCTDGQFTAGRRGAAGASGWARAPAWVATTTTWTICSSRCTAHGTRTARLRNTPLAVQPANPPYLHTYSAIALRVTACHTYLRRSCTRPQAGSAYRAEPVGVELTLNGLQFSDGGLLFEYEAEPVEAEVEAAPLPATE